jgi:hypothetical protein
MSPDKDDEPTQTTDKGLEIPVPEREDVFAALSRVARSKNDAARPEHGDD